MDKSVSTSKKEKVLNHKKSTSKWSILVVELNHFYLILL